MDKKIFTIVAIVLVIISLSGYSQDLKNKKDFKFSVSTDIMSRYVWRGTQFGGNSPSIQPGVSIKAKNLEFGFWGAYSLGGINSAQEFDYYLSYTFFNEMFSVIFTDYYFPDEASDYSYFEYNDTITSHILEGTFKFNGTDNIPFTFLAAVNFYGADAIRINSNPDSENFNTRTGIQYSTYLELGYNKTIKDIDFNAFIGANLNKSKSADNSTGYIGEKGFYGNKEGVVNLGVTVSKDIKITEIFSLPLSASAIINPMSEKVYLFFGISL